MDNLLALVKHEIEGEESYPVTMLFADSEPVTEQRQTFGPDRWADHAKNCGDITALQFLAIALFVVGDQFNLHRANSYDDRERRIVETWSKALRDAASSGAIIPRDPDSLLPLQAPPDDFNWRLAVADADTWLATQGFTWTCTQIIEHLYRESFPDAGGSKMPDGAAKPATEAIEHGGERTAVAKLVGALVLANYKLAAQGFTAHGLVAEIIRDIDGVKGVNVSRETVEKWLSLAAEKIK
jgi:hypothetical protein